MSLSAYEERDEDDNGFTQLPITTQGPTSLPVTKVRCLISAIYFRNSALSCQVLCLHSGAFLE